MSKTSDNRERPRYLCGTVTLTRLALAAIDNASCFAWVHDISENGVGLDCLRSLGSGVDIVFEVKGNQENEKVRLHAQVVHATPVGSFYRLGCRLTVPLRPSVLGNLIQKLRGS